MDLELLEQRLAGTGSLARYPRDLLLLTVLLHSGQTDRKSVV